MSKKFLFVIFSTISSFCWLILFNWYSIFKHINTPFFALDKIEGHFASSQIKLTLLIFILLSVIYVVNYFLLKSIKTKLKFLLLLLAPIIIAIFIYPIGALDIFNYVAESKLFFFYKANPYTTTFNTNLSDPLNNFAIFLNVPLAYGPLWLFSTVFIFIFSHYDSILFSVILFKIYNSLLFLICGFLVYKIINNPKHKIISCYLFIANPFIIFETIVNGHNDILFTFFLLLTILFIKNKSYLSLPVFLLSVTTKYFSLILLPILLVVYHRFFKLTDYLKSFIISITILVMLYLPFWSDGQLLSYLPQGIRQAQSLDTYSIFSLVREYMRIQNVSSLVVNEITFFIVFLVISLTLVITYYYRHKKDFISPILLTLILLLLILSAFQPWYLISVISLFILKNSKVNLFYIFSATFSSLIFYPLSLWAWFNSGFDVFTIHLFSSLFFFIPILFLAVNFFIRILKFGKSKYLLSFICHF